MNPGRDDRGYTPIDHLHQGTDHLRSNSGKSFRKRIRTDQHSIPNNIPIQRFTRPDGMTENQITVQNAYILRRDGLIGEYTKTGVYPINWSTRPDKLLKVVVRYFDLFNRIWTECDGSFLRATRSQFSRVRFFPSILIIDWPRIRNNPRSLLQPGSSGYRYPGKANFQLQLR